MKNIKIYVVALLALASLFSSCNPEPTYYSQTTPELFFDSQMKVYQRMGRPFTHWAWCVAGNERQASAGFPILQEMTTDEMMTPKRYNDWYDGGKFIRYYKHDFSPAYGDAVAEAWRLFSMGVAQTWSAKEDIETYVDFDALGFPEGASEEISMQLQVLAAYFCYYGLDLFGGIPLYTSNQGDALPRSTDVETFEFIENLLTEALPELPKKAALGAQETSTVNQAAAAMLLARLYFNAESYIREDRYADAAKICQDIIDGVYGPYDLDSDWTAVFGFDNDRSPEILWTVPSENSVSERSVDPHSSPYGMKVYWGNNTVGSTNNGYCLVPSLDLEGKSYVYGSDNPSSKGTYRLGSPFAKFHEKDVRKQLFAYEGDKKWRGMFLMGELTNPVTGNQSMGGGRQVGTDKVVTLVDQVGRLTLMNDNDGKPLMADHLKEGIEWAEEASGIRLTKQSPIPWESENTLKGNPDIPVMRMAEVYYTLAECKMRAGDKAAAAELINAVRARYFVDGDPDPVTAANLDEWRMLDEWMLEFIGEGRRRIDLVRWDKFTTESWWDHPADGPGKAHLNRFPIPETILGSNPLLEQNPGYPN
ncbi:MAG: RagB/SusD family nutrient uptake outer membrane protein [Alistipes sp.]|jgi:hypothetical protein|nr:RagB/SusD family nutrient uptake outer membrane protein [Alistipes sp.]